MNCETCGKDQSGRRRYRCGRCRKLCCYTCNHGHLCHGCELDAQEERCDERQRLGRCRYCGDENRRPRSGWCSQRCRHYEALQVESAKARRRALVVRLAKEQAAQRAVRACDALRATPGRTKGEDDEYGRRAAAWYREAMRLREPRRTT